MKPRYYILTALYCSGIFWLSSQSLTTLPKVPVFGIDKIAHLIIYGGLTAIVSLGLRRSGRPVSKWVQCGVPVLFCVLYGLSDETHQLFVPNRSCDIFDLFADGTGGVLAQAWLCGARWRLWRAGPGAASETCGREKV